MRPTIIAGNWKMHKDLAGTRELLTALTTALPVLPAGVQAVICPPYTSLTLAAEMLKDTPYRLGAQNMSEHDEGAYTGEVSWGMLKSAGVVDVILGHSERRQFFGETDASINRKAKKALAGGLRPILCVGETLLQREGGMTESVVTGQVKGVLEGIPARDVSRLILAYEPVWAIGTGKNATPSEAEAVHRHIRGLLRGMYSSEVADEVPLQYGGSVKPDNAAELLAQDDIDGALVGGACLKSDSFAAIIRAARA